MKTKDKDMFTISKYQKCCTTLRKTAREALVKMVEEYGKLLFVDGDGNGILDLAVGPVDKETEVYPTVNFVGRNGKGEYIVNTTDGVACEDIDFCLDDVDISTDDLCNLADNALHLVNCEFDVEYMGQSIGRQNYKALLLLDTICEFGDWSVEKVYCPGE